MNGTFIFMCIKGIDMKKLPIFKALISNENDKMVTISLVDFPATESDFVAFEKENERVMFSVENEEKRLVRGLVMAANQLIYRYSPNFGEYYIMYEPETIRAMAEKYLKEGFQNNVDLMHDGNLVDGVNMVQFFIKDAENGINPKPFEEYEDGSLFAEFHVENDEVWNMIKDGDFKGFSLEGFFTVEPVEFRKEETNNKSEKKNYMSKVSRIKELLKQMVELFGEVSTDKGVIVFDGDELEAGMNVMGIDEEGNEVPLEDGEYTTEDKKIIVVADGKVVEIKDDKAEVSNDEPADEPAEDPQENADDDPSIEPAEEPAADNEPEVDEKDAIIEELKARIAELEAENEELKAKVDELSQEPAASSAEEEFEKINEVEDKSEAGKLRKKGYKF